MKTSLVVLAVLVLWGIGFGGGYMACDWSATHAKVKQATLQVRQDDKAMSARIAEEHSKAQAAEASLQLEQGKTAILNVKLAGLRADNQSLTEQLSHAHFRSPAVPAVAGTCPGSPFADPEYVRLYNRAAQGDAAGRADYPRGGSSGVLAQRVRGVP